MKIKDVQVQDGDTTLHPAQRTALFGWNGTIWTPLPIDPVSGGLSVDIISGLTEYTDGYSISPAKGLAVLGFSPETGTVEILRVNTNGTLTKGFNELTSSIEVKGYGATALPYQSSIFSTLASYGVRQYNKLTFKLRVVGTAGGTVHASIWGSQINNSANFSMLHEFNQGVPFDPTGGVDFNETVDELDLYYQYRLVQATGITGSPNSSLHAYGRT